MPLWSDLVPAVLSLRIAADLQTSPDSQHVNNQQKLQHSARANCFRTCFRPGTNMSQRFRVVFASKSHTLKDSHIASGWNSTQQFSSSSFKPPGWVVNNAVHHNEIAVILQSTTPRSAGINSHRILAAEEGAALREPNDTQSADK